MEISPRPTPPTLTEALIGSLHQRALRGSPHSVVWGRAARRHPTEGVQKAQISEATWNLMINTKRMQRVCDVEKRREKSQGKPKKKNARKTG